MSIYLRKLRDMDIYDLQHSFRSQMGNTTGLVNGNSKWLCHDNTSIQIALRCNGQVDCPDGSDETAGMCASTQINMAQNTFFCVLPEYPEHGTYTVEGMPDAKAGMKVLSLRMTVKCDPGFLLQGSETVTCNAGEWSSKIPQCSRECTLKPLLQSPSVEYWCEAPDSGERSAPCEERQPTGSVVRPACKAPFYYSPVSLPLMHCIDGNWDYVPNCVQQCGILAPGKEKISAVPYNVTKGELPWYATIYTKRTKPYSALCGGTIVSPTTIISVAHCFWSETQTLPSSNYVVAVGNLYRTWNHKRDTDVQKIPVKRIKIPISFRGVINNYQDDIAVVILSEPIVYTRNILPVCLDFDPNFNSLQLEPGALGKVGGFGLVDTGATRPPPTLKSIDLPYIDITLCIRYAPIQFRECITWDKICAAYSYGTDVCEGDSGGGLVFPETEKQVTRYYLRGILSISPVPAQANEKRVCHKIAVITFTELIRHERFIRENIEIAMPQYKDDDNIKKPDGGDSTVLRNVDEFGCKSGECDDAASICDGKRDCNDGSDESDDACTDDTRAQKSTTTTERSTTKNLTHINNDLATVDKCIMPSQPENGVYHVVGCEKKDNKVTFVKLEYSCYKRFAMLEDPTVYCSYGIWSGARFPQCLQTCYLDRHESMNYDCVINGTELTRPCKDFEVEGTVIKPSCKKPNYFTPMELPYMFCRKGQWSSLPTCVPECGKLTPKCAVLVLGGETAKFGDVPWHAGIYHKSCVNGTHVQICGGSLISNSVILSAAHCFWDERENCLHSVKRYSVAVGKLHRDWDDPDDEQIAQKSDVKKIVIPDDYFGNQQNYDYDIAIVIVSGTFQYKTYVRPVCLDFVQSQLYPGAVGMAAGWGLTTGNRGSESPELRIVNMTFVSKSKCRNETLFQYRPFLTHDKFCAGDKEGIALCRGDSGGGLAFPETVFNTVRFYIHGIASTKPPSKDINLCNTDTFTMFTNIYWYQNLIKTYWFT
ncbi:Coagulation factor X [Papilio machaon]|uniref:Coagulation factor X n=1 Tax=Papilio machaon TaxID=76193 RepID=A0A0N1I6Q2_PAPMA|nr:Coagulation factor X [Papilio machaon]